jgi:disulfide bond formation protein DsbB
MRSSHRPAAGPNIWIEPLAAFIDARSPVPWTPRIASAFLVAVSAGTIAMMFTLQYAGFEPCELCYLERIPFYAVIALASLAFWMAGAGRTELTRVILIICALAFVFDAGLFAYHAGVEWKWWPGPDSCTGQLVSDPSVSMMERLKAARVVRCDEPALRIFGISLAGYGAPMAAGLAVLAFLGAASRSRPPSA